jgi:phage replication-related protein YjqB (UPF0714/DUF867 family)
MANKMPTNQDRLLVRRYIQKLVSISLATILLFSVSFLSWTGSAQADSFGCFQLTGNPPECPNSTNENALVGSVCLSGINNDWHTTSTPLNQATSDVTVISIHGDKIEKDTTQIGNKLQSLYNWNRYDFSGHVRSDLASKNDLNSCYNLNSHSGSNFEILHITSNNFNDQTALNLIGAHPKAVSIHGCKGACPTNNTICVGGNNNATVNNGTNHPQVTQIVDFRDYVDDYKNLVDVVDPLKEEPLTFNVPLNIGDAGATCDPSIKGNSLNNIVNKTSTRQGLQLEMSEDIRARLANNDIADELLRGVIFGGVAKALGELPLPLVTANGTENYSTGSGTFTRYKLKVENKIEYPSALFAPAPDLPACGLNANSSRTWVNIYNAANDQYIYGFCALGSPQNLDSIWFAVAQGTNPPASVYVTLQDRQTARTYRSNTVPIQ